MPTATITLDFDPILLLADGMTVRWQTIALAVVVLVALAALGWVARRSELRPDDLLFAAAGIVPGAVVGGRIGYALVHADYYIANPLAVLDPSQGSLSLGLAVVGGTLTGVYILSLLEAPVSDWLQAAAVPVIGAVGAGKLTMALGGAGQGLPSDAAWATSYVGPGPWGSLGPEIAAHPAQLYEGIAALAIAGGLAVGLAVSRHALRNGRAFLVGLLGLSVARAIVGFTWRDAEVIGPLRADQLTSIAIAVGCAVMLLRYRIRFPGGSPTRQPGPPTAEWPDPATRPRF